MNLLRKLRRDEQGAAVIEMAFALPVLIVMMWMIVQLGLVFRAMSGIQHGLGEGARTATVYSSKTTAQRQTEIKDKITDAVYGIGPGSFKIEDPVPGVKDGANYLDLQVSYTQPTDLLLFPGPTIAVTRSKRVWISL
ncbi:MAG: TadE/TadG family type IV pilus assembly protein [Pseudomonadota bacterium]